MKKSILRFYKRFKVYLGKLGRSKGLKTEEYLQDHEKIAFRICVKLISHEDSELVIEGRHDPCIVQRAVPVIEAVTAIGILDLIL